MTALDATVKLALVNFLLAASLVYFWSQLEPSIEAKSKMGKPGVSGKQAVIKKPDAGSAKNPAAIAQDPSPLNLFDRLAEHNQPQDCWITYQGHLYNITSYFGSHPGGDASLASVCGQDATAAFETKNSQPPRNHSASAQALLERYLIQ